MNQESHSPKTRALFQFSYVIEHADGPLSIADLKVALEENSIKIRQHVWTGWSMFYVFTRPEFAPKVMSDDNIDGGNNFLQTDLSEGGAHLSDFWRVSPRGWASLLRPYREDGADINKHYNRPQGGWIDPETIVRETAEFVRHAFLMSQNFPTAQEVAISCTWNGLNGRYLQHIDDRYIPYRDDQYVCHQDSKTTKGAWHPAHLLANWESVVAALACPVLELFQFDKCGTEFIKTMGAKRFVKLPPEVG